MTLLPNYCGFERQTGNETTSRPRPIFNTDIENKQYEDNINLKENSYKSTNRWKRNRITKRGRNKETKEGIVYIENSTRT